MEYFAPATVSEALKLKRRLKGSAFLAGGTILNWRGAPRQPALIDLRHLPLRAIKVKPKLVSIGALVTIQEVMDDARLPAALNRAASFFMSRNVRNMATVGGTVAGRFLISCLQPVFAAYLADVEYQAGPRKAKLPLAKWIEKRPGLVTAAVITNPKRSVFVDSSKIAGMDFPLVVTAIGFELRKGRIARPVVAVSGVAAGLALSARGAAFLQGKRPDELEWSALNEAVQAELRPAGNVKASPRVVSRHVESQIKNMVALAREVR